MTSPFASSSLMLRALRRQCVREVATLLLFASLLLQSATAVAPGWWSTQQVLIPGAVADDYTVANLGQLKNMARKAAQEFNSMLTDGAGNDINALIAEWEAPPAAGVQRDDYAALTIGQLKRVARLFYDRLAEAGVTEAGSYPWSGTNPDDYAPANVGQLKSVFRFETDTADANQNSMPDVWEMQKFGSLAQSASDDYDHDGLSNLAEYQAGTTPANADTDGDGVSDGQEVADGTDPTTPPPSWTWTQAELDAAAAAYEIGLQQRSRYVYADNMPVGAESDTNYEIHFYSYLDSDDVEANPVWDYDYNSLQGLDTSTMEAGGTTVHQLVAGQGLPEWASPEAAVFVDGRVEATTNTVDGVTTTKAEFRLIRRLKAGATAPVDSKGNLIKPEIKRIFLKVTTTLPATTGTAPVLEVVKMTIPVDENASSETNGLFFPPAIKTGICRIELVPIDIVVAFGFSPVPEMKAVIENNLRQISSCVSSLGDANDAVCAFLMKGKPFEGKDQATEKLWAVLTTNRADELKFGLAGVPYVMFYGHSNMGMGPAFDVSAIHSPGDFFNIGNPQAAINLPYLKKEGYPQDLTVLDKNVPQDPHNYTVLPQKINIQRFDNSNGVLPGVKFNLQGVKQKGKRATGYHFNRPGGSKFLICDVPDATRAADLTPLGYQVFFYNACNTARDYAEVFQHGIFICSNDLIAAADDQDNLDQSAQTFINDLIAGESMSVIFNEINVDQRELNISNAYSKLEY